MRSKWVEGKLGDFIELKRGYDLPAAQRIRGSYPIISSSGETDCHHEFKVRGPGVVTGRYGTIGQVFYVDQDFWPLNTALYVRDFKGNDPKFVSYFLKTVDFWAYSDKAAVPGVNRNHLHEAKVIIPGLPAQKDIARVLGLLDDLIANINLTNATLEAIAQAIFKSWFIDFDPVHAKAKGLIPEGMHEATAELFPDSFEESVSGVVPAGWRMSPFGKLLCYAIGGDWGTEGPAEGNDERVAIIRGTDIPDLKTGSGMRVPIRYTSKKKLGTRRLVDGDLVLEVSGGSKDQPTGRALYITKELLATFDCPVEPASFCRLLRPTSKEIGLILGQHLEYIYSQGKTWEYQNQSTGIANFQTTHFLEAELVMVPSQKVMQAFNDLVRPMIDMIHANIAEARTLEEIRDTLLPRLISGKLRIPEAEELLEAVAA